MCSGSVSFSASEKTLILSASEIFNWRFHLAMLMISIIPGLPNIPEISDFIFWFIFWLMRIFLLSTYYVFLWVCSWRLFIFCLYDVPEDVGTNTVTVQKKNKETVGRLEMNSVVWTEMCQTCSVQLTIWTFWIFWCTAVQFVQQFSLVMAFM